MVGIALAATGIVSEGIAGSRWWPMTRINGGLGFAMRRSLKVLVEDRLSPEKVGERVATYARSNVRSLIAGGYASPRYHLVVNGVPDAQEETVARRLNGGTIVYIFSKLGEAAVFGLTFARQISPRRPGGGAYSKAWIILVDGLPWTAPLQDIPASAVQIAIVNYTPYSRRLEQQFGKKNPAFHITEFTRSATQKQFPSLVVRRQFISLPAFSGGIWPVPYVRQTDPQGPITYPAVVISRP